MKRPQNLVLVATWQLFSAMMAFFGLLTMIGIILAISLSFNNYWGFYAGPFSGMGFASGIFTLFFGTGLLFLLAFFIISLSAGIGTLRGRPWARNLGIAQAVLSVLNVPVGTVIGVLIIMYLGKPEVTEYFRDDSFKGNTRPVLNPAPSA